jgi:RNA recognition motif-containing protein
MSVRLYVGNLPKEEVNRDELHAVFAEIGDTVTTKVIKDRKTGKCRGFAFVTVPTDELADQIIDKFNGQTFKETVLKIEKALPRSKGGEDEEGNGEEKEVSTVEKPTIASERNIPAPSKSNRRTSDRTSSDRGSSSSGGGGKKSNKRAAGSTSMTSGDSDTIQPDPRWADQLAVLKQRLEAQTTNP